MSKLIVTLGVPASGKTTWTNEYLKENRGTININRDDLRESLFGVPYKFSNDRENTVTNTAYNIARQAASLGQPIIISDTNLNRRVFENWKEFAEEAKYEFEVKSFLDLPIGVAMERNRARMARGERGVPSNVITRMWENAKKFFPEYMPIQHVHKDSNPTAYIFDIDGTLAKMNGRRPYDWDRVDEDLPNDAVVRIFQSLERSGMYQMIIFSGRDGECLEKTKQWLTNHGIYPDMFVMREAGDNRADYVIKKELYMEHVHDKFNVVTVFDDRDQVVHLWRHLGIPTFQVDYGDF